MMPSQGLHVGSREWVEALKNHSDDFDVKMLCEAYLQRKKFEEQEKQKFAAYVRRQAGLNVLLAHAAELTQQLSRVYQTMVDMTKETSDGQRD
jgi:hypothetical protein